MKKDTYKRNKTTFFFCFFLSALLWIIPFLIRIFLIDFSDNEPTLLPQVVEDSQDSNVINEIIHQLDAGNQFSAFSLVFWNNLKVCIINMAGGALLGILTIVSLLQNGFFTADVLTNIHSNGMPVSIILKYTLPHSVEILGAWLSGTIGFCFTRIIIDYLRIKILPDIRYIRFLGVNILIVLLITLVSAYIEVYISILT